MTPSVFLTFHDIVFHFQTPHFRKVRRVSLSVSVQDLQRHRQECHQQRTLRESCVQGYILLDLLVEFCLHIIKFFYHALKHIILIFRDCYIMFFKRLFIPVRNDSVISDLSPVLNGELIFRHPLVGNILKVRINTLSE